MQTLVFSTFAMCFVIYGMIVFAKDFSGHWNENRADLIQSWKLATLAIGLSWLLGALYGGVAHILMDATDAFGDEAFCAADCRQSTLYGLDGAPESCLPRCLGFVRVSVVICCCAQGDERQAHA